MPQYDYDVLVIGAGPAGQKAAMKCARAGKRTALVDMRQVVGGRCLHTGTIPSKTIRAAIIYLSGYYERKIYGSGYRVKQHITAEDLIFRCNAIINREIEVIREQLEQHGVHVLYGNAQFAEPHTIRIGNIAGTAQLSAEYIVLCTGSTSKVALDLPFDGRCVLNTDDILSIAFLPQRLTVLGAGVIGLEYASMFSLLDIAVTVVSPYTSLLPFIDQHLVAALRGHMERHGVRFALGEEVGTVSANADGDVTTTLKSGMQLRSEMLLHAPPRIGNTGQLNLAAAGLCCGEQCTLSVNEHYQTAVPHIYAAGDVIGYPALASTSIDQGRKAANHLLHVQDIPYEPLFPYGIYTFPDMSMIGASEEKLIEQGRPYLTGTGYYRESARGQIIGDEDGLIKLVFDPESRELLGVHIIGAEATELIHLGQAVMISKGKIDYFLDTVFNYPTLAEVYKIAALDGFQKTPASRPMDYL